MSTYDKLQNEGGEGYVDYAKRYPKEPAAAEQEAILGRTAEEMRDAFAAEWTAEVTASRRAAWNAEATKGTYPGIIQKKLGFSMDDLKKAVAIHAK